MAKIDLTQIPTKQLDRSLKEEIKVENAKMIERIAYLQRVMYAERKHAILIVIQGMDASGKDGAIRKTFSGVNPHGVRVKAYKKPTDEELAHDFLWRIHEHAPKKGMIQVFNRSHYEDILVPSVYHTVDENEIKSRYELINQFENILQKGNNTTILKFYLHTSKEEQYKRLRERIEIKEKHWKHNDSDWDTREHWDEFMEVYQNIFQKCNQPQWHIVPSDRNWEKVNYMAKTVLNAMENLHFKWPNLNSERFIAEEE